MKEQLIEIINLYRIKKLNNNANAEKLEDVIFRMELVIDDSNINCDFNKIHQVLNEVLGQEGTSSIITNLNDYLSLMNLSVTYNVNRAIDECKHKCYSDIQTLTLEAESLKLDLEKIQKCDLLISQLQTEKPIADIYFVANILKQTGLELNQQNELLIWLANYNLTLPSSLEINRLNAEAFSPLSEDEKIMYLLVEQNINNYNDQIVSDIKNYVGITNLELAFAIFNNYNFDLSKIDIEILLQILIKSNSNNLETIFKFITDKKIDHEILISYPGLFIKNENNLSNNKKGLKFKTKIIGLQDSFIKIYEFFENLNYDMETFTQKGRSVLLSNFNTISHNFAILKQYQFNVEPNQEGKSNLPFSVFKINNLDQMIDSYIEEGLNSYIHSAPSLLNNNFAYKKVHLKRKYNEPYENKNHLVKEINSQKKKINLK